MPRSVLPVPALLACAVLATSALAVLCGPASADVLFSTIDAGGEFDHAGADVAAYGSQSPTVFQTRRSAARFSIVGGPYRLDSVTLPIGVTSTSPRVALCVILRRDQEGAPGDALETLTISSDWPVMGTPFGATKLVSANGPELTEGAYWLETCLASIPDQNQWDIYRWQRNNYGALLTVYDDATPWVNPPNQAWSAITPDMLEVTLQARAFRVDGTPVSAGATALSLPSPTPFRGSTHIGYSLARAGALDISVFSVSGARVRTLAVGDHAAGSGSVEWDGLDDRGQRAPAGVYLVRLQAAGTHSRQRIVKLD